MLAIALRTMGNAAAGSPATRDAHPRFEQRFVLPERYICKRERTFDGVAHLGIFDQAYNLIRFVIEENRLTQWERIRGDLTRKG